MITASFTIDHPDPTFAAYAQARTGQTITIQLGPAEDLCPLIQIRVESVHTRMVAGIPCLSLKLGSANPEDLVVGFGKHSASRWSQLPRGYLKWMTENMDGDAHAQAHNELLRRAEPAESADTLESNPPPDTNKQPGAGLGIDPDINTGTSTPF